MSIQLIHPAALNKGPGFAEPPDTAAYDALTDLFLGAEPAGVQSVRPGSHAPAAATRGQTLPPVPRAREMELLVMGHLPVRSNPWAPQYARATADQLRRPVALIRMIGGEIAIDLFGVPPSEREGHTHDDLESSLAHAMRVARRLLIQVDEADIASGGPLAGFSHATLLCAGNEAAVVAAFQSIKSLADSSHPACTPSTQLQVAVMGADDAGAATIGERLKQAAGMFLKREVRLAAGVGRMGPTGGAGVYRAECRLDPAELIRLIAKLDLALLAGPRPVVPTSPQPVPEIRTRPSDLPLRSAVDALPPTSTPPKVPDPAPVAPPTHPSSQLACRLPGLTPLTFRCPDDGSVEFAKDAEGGLHLLRSGDDPEALRSLTAAEAWAAKNRELLALAVPGLNTARRATPHLFTAAAPSVRTLLDSGVRVHLLANVQIEGKCGWFCTELN